MSSFPSLKVAVELLRRATTVVEEEPTALCDSSTSTNIEVSYKCKIRDHNSTQTRTESESTAIIGEDGKNGERKRLLFESSSEFCDYSSTTDFNFRASFCQENNYGKPSPFSNSDALNQPTRNTFYVNSPDRTNTPSEPPSPLPSSPPSLEHSLSNSLSRSASYNSFSSLASALDSVFSKSASTNSTDNHQKKGSSIINPSLSRSTFSSPPFSRECDTRETLAKSNSCPFIVELVPPTPISSTPTYNSSSSLNSHKITKMRSVEMRGLSPSSSQELSSSSTSSGNEKTVRIGRRRPRQPSQHESHPNNHHVDAITNLDSNTATAFLMRALNDDEFTNHCNRGKNYTNRNNHNTIPSTRSISPCQTFFTPNSSVSDLTIVNSTRSTAVGTADVRSSTSSFIFSKFLSTKSIHDDDDDYNNETSKLLQQNPDFYLVDKALCTLDRIEDEIDEHTYDDLIPLSIRMTLEEHVFGWSHLCSDILGHIFFVTFAFWSMYWFVTIVGLHSSDDDEAQYGSFYHKVILDKITNKANRTDDPSTNYDASQYKYKPIFNLSMQTFHFIRIALSLLSSLQAYRTVRRRRMIWLRSTFGTEQYLRDTKYRELQLQNADRNTLLGRIRSGLAKKRDDWLSKRVQKKLSKARRRFERRHFGRKGNRHIARRRETSHYHPQDALKRVRNANANAKAMVDNYQERHHRRVRLLSHESQRSSTNNSTANNSCFGDVDSDTGGEAIPNMDSGVLILNHKKITKKQVRLQQQENIAKGDPKGVMNFEAEDFCETYLDYEEEDKCQQLQQEHRPHRESYYHSHTMPSYAMQSIAMDQIHFSNGVIENVPYAHGGFFGAAPFMLANPHWIDILRNLMPDVYVAISNRVLRTPMPKLIHWAENNPVVAAYGTAHEIEYTGQVPTLEWDVFLDPHLVRRVEIVLEGRDKLLKKTLSLESFHGVDEGKVMAMAALLSPADKVVLQFYNDEIKQRVTALLENMLIAHGNLTQLILEQTGYLKNYNFSRVKRTCRTLGGGIYAKNWVSVYSQALRMGMDKEQETMSLSDSVDTDTDIDISSTKTSPRKNAFNGKQSMVMERDDKREGGGMNSINNMFVPKTWDDQSASPLRERLPSSDCPSPTKSPEHSFGEDVSLLVESDFDDEHLQVPDLKRRDVASHINIVSGQSSGCNSYEAMKSQTPNRTIKSSRRRNQHISFNVSDEINDSSVKSPTRLKNAEALSSNINSLSLNKPSTCLNAYALSTCPTSSIKESISLLKTIMDCEAPLGLVLDLKSRHVPKHIWALVVDALRDAGARVEGIASFFIDEIRDISHLCSAPVKEIIFFHGAGDLQKACHDGLIKNGDSVFFNAGSLFWNSPDPNERGYSSFMPTASLWEPFDAEETKKQYRFQSYARIEESRYGIPQFEDCSVQESSTETDQSDEESSDEDSDDYIMRKLITHRTGKSIRFHDGRGSTVQEYKERYNLSIGLYVQEFAIDDYAIDLLVKYVNENPHVYNLGLSWGGVNGVTVRGIQPGRFTNADGYWNQRYAGRRWDISQFAPTNDNDDVD